MKKSINIDLPLPITENLLLINNSNKIKIQFYGSVNNDFPTGRPKDIEHVELDSFTSLVQEVKENNDEFNYLLNGNLGAFDISSFYKYFSWIINTVKPNVITFSDPAVYHYIVDSFDFTNFEISAIVGIKDEKDFERFILKNNINIEHISKLVFHHDITRNYSKVASFIKLLKRANIISRVLVTESCYNKCPLRNLHYNSFVEAYKTSNDNFINHYQVHCISKRLLQPESLLDLSGFLLPEQLNNYAKETGISTFKISGRSESTEWIYNTAQAYVNEKSPDNLFEIIVFTSPFLSELGLKISDLFYLNSKAYFKLYKELITITDKTEKQLFLDSQACELFLKGLFRINDPNSTYDIVDGKLKVLKNGDYLNILELKANPNLKGTVFYKSKVLK